MYMLHFAMTYVCSVTQVMFRNVLGKTLGFVGYTVQYGCIAHCAFEYIGEFVIVRIIKIAELMTDIFLKLYKSIFVREATVTLIVFFFFLSAPVPPWSPPLSTKILSSLNGWVAIFAKYKSGFHSVDLYAFYSLYFLLTTKICSYVFLYLFLVS